jgi:hypothetical protein
MNSPHYLASQHIKGKHNVVSDLLSFENSDQGYLHPLAYDSPDDNILTQRFHAFLPTQIPLDFTITTPQRNVIRDHASTASWQIIFDHRQEAANENQEHLWGTALNHFCSQSGLQTDPFLTALHSGEQELILRSFLGLYQMAKWSRDGKLAGSPSTPVVGGTVRTAASSLAAAFASSLAVAFWSNHRPSPFHHQGGTNLHPVFPALL